MNCDPTGYYADLSNSLVTVAVLAALTSLCYITLHNNSLIVAKTKPSFDLEFDFNQIIKNKIISMGINASIYVLPKLIHHEVEIQKTTKLQDLRLGTVEDFKLKFNQKQNDENPKIVFRALKKEDVTTLSAGRGIIAKNVAGDWTLEKHITDGSKIYSKSHDPFISTTFDPSVAQFFNKEYSYGIVVIDLNKINTATIRYPFIECMDSEAKELALKQREISISRFIPQCAIIGYYE